MDSKHRFKPGHPCPVCGGHQRKRRNRGERCYGYLSPDSKWANCTRDDFGGSLKKNLNSGTYAHLLNGPCNCGADHSSPPVILPDNPIQDSPELTATYDYRDADGNISYQVLRYVTSSGGRTFRQRQNIANWSLQGVERLPYKLPELLAAPLETPVFITEGEKDVDRLTGIGLVATCNNEGAGKFREELVKWFKDRKVVLVADNDEEGHRHVEKTASLLSGIAASIRILFLPGLPPKGDVSDWLDEGNTLEDLNKLASDTGEYLPSEEVSSVSPSLVLGEEEGSTRLRIIRSTDIGPATAEDMEGILGPILPPKPALILLSAETSSGKTVLCYRIASNLAKGKGFLGYKVKKAYKVLYLDLESPMNLIRDRIEKIRGNDNLFICNSLRTTLDNEAGLEALKRACIEYQVEILFIDSLPQVWPVAREDDNSEADMQMWTLKKLAVELDMLCIVLWNTGQGHLKDKHKARGATARVDRSDVALVYKDITQDSRELKVAKSRYGTINESVKLRFTENLGFEVVTRGISLTTTRQESMMVAIMDQFSSGVKKIYRRNLVREHGNENLVDKALTELKNSAQLQTKERGVYERVVPSSSASI